MRIEVHPKPDGMQHINFMFCDEDPGPEDLWVQAVLNDFPTPPKRILDWERDGLNYKVMQYGGYVVGHLMFYIDKHIGVVNRIRQLCQAEFDRSQLLHQRLFELISETAVEFSQEAKFTVDGNGELAIAIDEPKLQQRIRERLKAESVDTTSFVENNM